MKIKKHLKATTVTIFLSVDFIPFNIEGFSFSL